MMGDVGIAVGALGGALPLLVLCDEPRKGMVLVEHLAPLLANDEMLAVRRLERPIHPRAALEGLKAVTQTARQDRRSETILRPPVSTVTVPIENLAVLHLPGDDRVAVEVRPFVG